MSQLQLLFAVGILLQSCNCQQIPANATVGFVPAPQWPYGRGTLDIVWGCLFTLFVCFWSVQHPNLAKFEEHRVNDKHYRHKLANNYISQRLEGIFGLQNSPRSLEYARAFGFRLTSIFMGICGPEFLLGWAYTEWYYAGQLRDKANKRWRKLRKQENREREQREQDNQRESPSLGEPDTDSRPKLQRISKYLKKSAEPVEDLVVWTRTHGFCAIMRGFAVQHGSNRGAVERNWTEQDLYTDDADLVASMQLVTKEDLQDKSKASLVVKLLASLQIAWFVIQQIARSSLQLPRTQLEVATIAYVLCTLPAYLFYMRYASL